MKLTVVGITVFLVLCLTGLATAQEPGWMNKMRQVKLLTSSYEEVIDIFGMPIDGSAVRELSEDFDLREGRISVIFESGLCVVTDYSYGKPIGWKVPAYTAILISFTPRKKIKPDQLNLDLTGFRSNEVYDVPGAWVYDSDELGIDFGVKRNGFVGDFSLRPARKFKHLHC